MDEESIKVCLMCERIVIVVIDLFCLFVPSLYMCGPSVIR